jgi:hypothetical protein
VEKAGVAMAGRLSSKIPGAEIAGDAAMEVAAGRQTASK